MANLIQWNEEKGGKVILKDLKSYDRAINDLFMMEYKKSPRNAVEYLNQHSGLNVKLPKKIPTFKSFQEAFQYLQKL